MYSEPSSTTSSSMMGINNYFIKNVKGKEWNYGYLTIIPRARMGSESIAQPKAKWAIDSEAIRARGIIVLVKSN